MAFAMSRKSMVLAIMGFVVWGPSFAYFISFLASPNHRTKPDQIEYPSKGHILYVTPTEIERFHVSIVGFLAGTALWGASGAINRRQRNRKINSN
jgi:hypothetical protein